METLAQPEQTGSRVEDEDFVTDPYLYATGVTPHFGESAPTPRESAPNPPKSHREPIHRVTIQQGMCRKSGNRRLEKASRPGDAVNARSS